jgi:DtxR family Mn-dependent transcriptional regulator
MTNPYSNLLLLLLVGAVAVALWWPGVGMLARARRRRSQEERVNMEDALKQIYHGEFRGQTASLASVAGGLEIPAATVVGLVERMQRAGLVTLTDGRLLLTEDGKRYALQIIRAHRLWERYLADETGVDPTRWHGLAEQREHKLTPEDVNELARNLGYPRFDPHGDPIPTRDGTVPARSVEPLSSLAAGETAHVVHVEDEPEVVYAQLVAEGVYPGMVLRVNEIGEARVVVEADGRTIVLAPIVAANVSTQRVAVAEPEDEAAGATLRSLVPGERAEVARISAACRGVERRRLMDLGIVPGTVVEFERRGLTGGLAAYRVRDTLVALREEQADMIVIRPPGHDEERSSGEVTS